MKLKRVINAITSNNSPKVLSFLNIKKKNDPYRNKDLQSRISILNFKDNE